MEHLIISGLTMAGKELLCQLIYDTYHLVQTTTSKHPKVQAVLAQLDLEADLEVIKALVKEVEIEEEKEGKIDAVDVALINVKKMIECIKKELEIIQIEVDLDGARYFTNWRVPTFQRNLDNLVKHKTILDKRVQLLMDLLKLKRC